MSTSLFQTETQHNHLNHYCRKSYGRQRGDSRTSRKTTLATMQTTTCSGNSSSSNSNNNYSKLIFAVVVVVLHVTAIAASSNARNDPPTSSSSSSSTVSANSAAIEQLLRESDQANEQSGEQVPSLVVPSSLINSNNLGGLRTNRLLTIPNSLSRFLFSNIRFPQSLVDRQQSQLSSSDGGPAFGGLKRSSSSLDSLTGMTLGKRSIQGSTMSSLTPASNRLMAGSSSIGSAAVNYEPILDRHAAIFYRATPRMYDIGRHWTGSYDFAPYESSSQSNSAPGQDYY